MTAIATTFDSLEYSEILKDAGMPEKQAKAQAAILQKDFQAQDEKTRAELATKGDLRETELRLEAKIEASKHEMIRWYIGMTVALAGVIIAFYAIK